MTPNIDYLDALASALAALDTGGRAFSLVYIPSMDQIELQLGSEANDGSYRHITETSLLRLIIRAAIEQGINGPGGGGYLDAAEQIVALSPALVKLTLYKHTAEAGPNAASGGAILALGDREYGDIANVRGRSIAEVIGQLHALMPPQTG